LKSFVIVERVRVIHADLGCKPADVAQGLIKDQRVTLGTFDALIVRAKTRDAVGSKTARSCAVSIRIARRAIAGACQASGVNL
jgi:hypothetical protein